MKRILSVALLLMLFGMSGKAQVKMRDVFAAMPDSIQPLLTTNNRLDCIDFIENKMQARVKNNMDQYVELKELTADYLLLSTSEKSQLEMKLLPVSDSTAILCLVQTYMGPVADSHVRFFTHDWQTLSKEDAVKYETIAQRPQIESYFPSVPDDKKVSMQGVFMELKDLYLAKASLSAQSSTLTWTIGTDVLSQDAKKLAREYAKPVILSF